MHAALDRLHVKTSLARLELHDVRHELMKQYDVVRDRLRDLGEASEDRWDAVKESFDAAWDAFEDRFEQVMAEHGDEAG